MASRLQKRMTLRRKLHILRTLTNSKSVRKSSIIMDAFIHIYKLQLKLEAIKRQYLYLINHIQEVKVEKIGGEFLVRVRCKKGQNLLVSILDTFEEMGLNVLQAKVSCTCLLSIEAIVEAQDQGICVRDIEDAVHKAMGEQVGVEDK
ncbi:uncharacterized protein LOC130755179 [Actinidia eriantha]|uniref:Plant bHLH transcription factor ACT-like domain-containing protein n=1 Tax=Actinidia rufa TaxID=165716 RepID=A0A7J0G8M0_9ERIC|nr:uncharacterized protein LOC130755179 [Actinidia eriantha]GFZ07129.1 hypothetical protein Acr_19g0000660 [Actinidia rufa]